MSLVHCPHSILIVLFIFYVLPLTVSLKSFRPLCAEGQFVYVVLQHGGPRLQLVHYVPRGRHRDREDDRSVGEVVLGQREPQQVHVRRVAVQGPDAEPGVI